MDILLFLISSIFVTLWIDKKSKVATVVYVSGSIVILTFLLLASDNSLVSNFLQNLLERYYLPIKSVIIYSFNVAYFGYNLLVILQIYGIVILLLGSIYIVKNALCEHREKQQCVKISGVKNQYKKITKTKFVRKNKIFLRLCRFLD